MDSRERAPYAGLLFVLTIAVVILTCTGPAQRGGGKTSSSGTPTQTEIAAATAYAREIGSAAVLVLKEGATAYEFGDLTKKYMCHSIRKPFLGALYGIYVERGVIDMSSTLAELEVDDIAPSLTPREKGATIRDLLLSRSGVYHEAAGEAPSMVAARPERGSHEPGSFFYYNNWDFNALGTVFRELTGESIFVAFDREIARKIGMVDFTPADCTYVYERARSDHPAYFFRMSTRDMGRFGLLMQNLGRWEGREIVPESWIRESTTVYPVSNPGGDPYGYLWRVIPEEAGLGHGFYHTGLGVHLLAVLPEKKMVFVHRVNTDRDFDIRWPEIRKLMEMILSAIE